MKIDFSKPENKLNFAYRTNFTTLLLDCERLHISVTFHTHDRQYLGDYKAIDTKRKPITLNNYSITDYEKKQKALEKNRTKFFEELASC